MDDKTREWQMEMVMEKLRSKALQGKSFFDLAKSHRMALLEKRYPLDSVEKNLLQKCLDILQHSVKVNTHQAMVERLESISRQLGLKFMAGQTNQDWFISSDMFYLEVVLEANGGVRDVKIHHEGKVEQQSCSELVECLSKRDFADFTTQLEGLVSIYQVNAEKKVKCKAFSALQSLETDLATLASLQTFIKEPFNFIHKSPVGALEKRKGGHSMKLTYFVSPYDLLDVENKTCRVLNADSLGSAGLSATVTMESSSAHKLQISTLISISKNLSGKSTPVYAPLTAQNSNSLPAVFVLKLSEPLPMCISLVKKIMAVTDIEVADLSSPQPLVSLITQHSSAGQLNCGVNRGLFVTLPEQQHCYFVTENRNLDGVVVSSVPFTHPAHVAQILSYLRQQALFNALILSCIRPNSKQDVEKTIIFELMPWSWQHITVSFIHPYDENMTTAELDLTDIANLKCSVNSTVCDGHIASIAPEYPSKVLQRSFSIPITMRALLKSWQVETLRVDKADMSGHGGSNSRNSGGNLNNNSKNQQLPPNDFDSDVKMNLERTSDYSGLNDPYNTDFMNRNPGCQNFSTSSPANPELRLEVSLMETKDPDSVMMSKNLDMGTKKFRKRKPPDDLLWKRPKSQTDGVKITLECPSDNTTAVESCVSKDSQELSIGAQNSTTCAVELSGSIAHETTVSLNEEAAADSKSADSLMDVNGAEDKEKQLKGSTKKLKKNMVGVAATCSNEDKSSTLFVSNLDNKSMVPSSVSITPISIAKPNISGVPPGLVLERRPGIEIFPVASSPIVQPPVSSSITITAISSKMVSEEKSKSEKKKQSKTSESDKAKFEKKGKRKRDDSPMGPPHKVVSNQDSVSKPVSVSVSLNAKPTDSSSPLTSSSVGSGRKYSSPPTQSSLITSKLSSSSNSYSSKSSKSLPMTHSTSKAASVSVSPTSSPKNSSSISTNSNPKHNSPSPKQMSGSSGSGKPSMSTLKSAVSSPSSSSNKSSESKMKSHNKEPCKERDRKSLNFSTNSGRSSPKIKSSSVKLKQLDLPVDSTVLVSEGSTSASSSADAIKAQAAARNRKGSLSAVIDKLKSAQSGTGDADGEGNSEGAAGNSQSTNSFAPKDSHTASTYSSKTSDKVAANKVVDGGRNPSEYMIKPSSDGMKITINKTRMKDSKNLGMKAGGLSSFGTNSTKVHTGLKPGVVSGPASKKPNVITKTNSSSSLSSKNSSSKLLFRSNSSGNLSKSVKSTSNATKLSGSDVNRNKSKPSTKSGEMSKNILSSSRGGKASPTTMSRDDTESERSHKTNKMDTSHPAPIMEGFKQLDTKFQIPKLSARVNNVSADSESSKKLTSSMNDKSHSSITESIEIGAKNEPSILNKQPVVSLNPVKNISDKISSSSDSSRSKSDPVKVSESSDVQVMVADSTSSSEATAKPLLTNVALPKSKSDTSLKLSGSMSAYVASSKVDSLSRLKMDLPIPGLSLSNNNTTNTLKKVTESNGGKLVNENLSKLSEKQKLGGTSQLQEAAEILIDFSSSSFLNNNKILGMQKLNLIPERTMPFLPARKTDSPPVFPHSPSVQVHIVKSPASVLPSPHSASPCITDDELMDEALVGMGK